MESGLVGLWNNPIRVADHVYAGFCVQTPAVQPTIWLSVLKPRGEILRLKPIEVGRQPVKGDGVIQDGGDPIVNGRKLRR